MVYRLSPGRRSRSGTYLLISLLLVLVSLRCLVQLYLELLLKVMMMLQLLVMHELLGGEEGMRRGYLFQ